MEKIKRILGGITEGATDAHDAWLGIGATYSEHHIKHPYYAIAKLAISVGTDVRFTQPMEKVLWAAKINFEGNQIWMGVTKMRGFTVTTNAPSAVAKVHHRRFMGKLRGACGIVQHELAKVGKARLAADNVLVDNTFGWTWHTYKFFRERLEAALNMDVTEAKAKKKEDSIASGKGPVLDELGQRLQISFERANHIDRFTQAAVAFFYSGTDGLMECTLALRQPRPCTLKDFRDMDWATRFKTAFDLNGNPELANIYEELLWVKRRVRDIIMHGHSPSANYLQRIKGVGLIPLDPRVEPEGLQRDYYPLREDLARRILKGIDDFLDWVNQNDDAWRAWTWLKTGAVIPFEHNDDAHGYRARSSRQTWQALVDRIGYEVDATRNFEF